MIHSDRQLLFIFQQSPYQNSAAREALEAVFAAAAFEQAIRVLFIHDGVFQLLNKQEPPAGQKNQAKMLASLEMYGVDQLYVDQHSLDARHLNTDDFKINVSPITQEQRADLIDKAHSVLSF